VCPFSHSGRSGAVVHVSWSPPFALGISSNADGVSIACALRDAHDQFLASLLHGRMKLFPGLAAAQLPFECLSEAETLMF
jgi:hypothetical protein